MTDKVLCRYFIHNACTKGEACPFSHDKSDRESNICTFYLRGCCSYGSRCRYEHIAARKLAERKGWGPAASDQRPADEQQNSTSSHPNAYNVNGTNYYQHGMTLAPQSGHQMAIGQEVMYYTPAPPGSIPYSAAAAGPMVMAPGEMYGDFNLPEELWEDFAEVSLYEAEIETEEQVQDRPPLAEQPDESGMKPEERPVCSYAAAGDCPYEKDGGTCKQLHGDKCPTCGKRCLHPFRPEEREKHMESCRRREDRLLQLRKSQEVECSICLERVLSKARVSERKFGILSGCDHPFCIACIRGWRSGEHTTQGMDLDGVVRSCPVCRVQSHYITPSVVWYTDAEQKESIVEGYKRKLKSIDCRHFDFGDGACPFGTSCFYRHVFHDGTPQEVSLRHFGTADGTVKIAAPVRLSDFLDLDKVARKGRRA